jgi:alkylated DNA repair dioxygenase AlkB
MIVGLNITPNFITNDYENQLIQNITNEEWNTSLKRRTQHYGYTYNYKSRSITEKDYLGPFPKWLDELADYIVLNAKLDRKPDQIIINEYLPGQGISAHIDVPTIFDDHICSLSLGSDVNMIYSRNNQNQINYLESCSLLEMSSDARYKWTHSIPSTKYDVVDEIKKIRKTRWSVTFRKVILT